MKTQLTKKTLSLLISFLLILSMLPMSARAETEESQPVLAADSDISSGTPDGTPPVLTGMTLSADTVTAPGSIEVVLSATDDVSGVDYANLGFYCEETQKYLYCSVDNTYWDSESGDFVPYSDGCLHGTITVDEHLESGTFVLQYIDIRDVADNWNYYSANYDSEYGGANQNPIPDFISHRQITVLDSDVPDGTHPVLTGMTLSTDTVTAPGSLEVILSATDDISGVDYANLGFYCEETRKYLYCSVDNTYWNSESGDFVPYSDGCLHGTITVDQYLESGTFVLQYIDIRDDADNWGYYILNYEPEYADPNHHPIPDFITDREIEVTDSGTPDGTPPVLTGMTLSTDTITAPGSIEVVLSATDDVSGVDYANLGFFCEETQKYLYCSVDNTYWDSESGDFVPYSDGCLHGTITVDQYLETGTFVLQYIDIRDDADNWGYYIQNCDPEYAGPDHYPIPDFISQRQIQVFNSVPDVSTSVANPDFVDQIAGAEEDAHIVADFSGDATLPANAFEAIAGTDKTLDLVSDGVTWRFNGNDIVNDLKDIDLDVEIKPVEEHPSDAAQQIQEALDDTPAVVMEFPENGELPGKATIQIKMDHTLREYLGSDRGLYVYYYNNRTGMFELIASDLVIISDTYVEFTITHCSNYILTFGSVGNVFFVDVPGDAWYFDAVLWALDQEITNGYGSDTTFCPEIECTRAQVVTFLWRAMGSPAPSGSENPFRDVPAGEWYSDAVLWAVEQGITQGYGSNDTFNPDGICTRAQVVTFLQRCLSGEASSNSNPFTDVPNEEWFTSAVLWAVEEGITNGYGGNDTFAPNLNCTRSQIVTFLYRALN